MIEHTPEKQAGLGVGIVFRGLVGIDQACYQPFRGAWVVALIGCLRSSGVLFAGAPHEIAGSLERPPRLLGCRTQLTGNLKVPICVRAVGHGRSELHCMPARGRLQRGAWYRALNFWVHQSEDRFRSQ
jgi:hypothetical protein